MPTKTLERLREVFENPLQIPTPTFYELEWALRSDRSRWRRAATFQTGSIWRGGRRVDDRAMTEELFFFMDEYPQRIARIKKPNGTFILVPERE